MNPKLKCLRLITTQKCNLKCKYCFKEGFLYKENNQIDEDTYDRYLFLVKNLVQFFGFDSIRITGGEPFEYNNINRLVFDIISQFNQLDTAIITNGTEYNKIKEFILSLNQYIHLIRFNISLPTMDSNHYSQLLGENLIENVLSTIYFLKTKKIKFQVNCVVGPWSVDLENVLNYMSEQSIELKLILPILNHCNADIHNYVTKEFSIKHLIQRMSKSGYKYKDNAFWKGDQLIRVLIIPSDWKNYFIKTKTIRFLPDFKVSVFTDKDPVSTYLNPHSFQKSCESFVTKLEGERLP